MAEAPLLDTHAWIWWLSADSRLKPSLSKRLDALPPTARPLISAISLWEVATLVSLDRVRLDRGLEEWLELAAHSRTVRILPITAAIASEVARLAESFHRDPADRLIVSTARVHRLPVLTADSEIRKSGLVSLWA